MAAGHPCLREYAAYLWTRCPQLCPTVQQLHTNIVYLRGLTCHQKMDFTLPCGADEPGGCRLAAKLAAWNDFLWPLDAELRETRPGRFAMVGLPSPMLPTAFSTQRRHAGVLAHWFLTKHRCFESVEICQSRMPQKHSLLCDGLRLSHGLRHGKFGYYGLDDTSPKDILAAFTSTLTTLDTLEIVSVRFSDVSMGMLCDFLGACQVLSTLVFRENCLCRPKAEALARSIAGCSSLRKLHVDEVFLMGVTFCSVLGCLVSSSAHLEELVVNRKLLAHGGDYPHIFGPLFLALSEPGPRLEKLTVSNFDLGQRDLDVLVTALGVNGQLKCLKLLCRGPSQGVCFSLDQVVMRNSSLTDICAKSSLINESSLKALLGAIEANATLQSLVIDDARLTANEATGLLDALTANTTLQKFQLGKICQPGLLQFLKTIRCRHLAARLDFAAVYATTSDVISALRSVYSVASVCFEPADASEPPQLQRLSDAFCGNTSFLRSLTVRLPVIDSKLASTLSTELSSGRHLRKVCLDFPAEPPQVGVLMQGLGKSRRLEELTIRGWTFECAGAAAFRGMLHATRSVNGVTLEALTRASCDHLATELRRGLVSNYTLLNVKFCEHPWQGEGDLGVRKYLRRNQSLLIEASRFIVPPASNAKNAAAAFEKLQGSRALVTEVSRLAGLAEEEAAKLLTCRSRYLAENFLTVAGVVKEKVECRRTDAGVSGVQIDQIPKDCWLHIRRYLCVEDVLDEEGTTCFEAES
ncbi:uncharacterized protein LOC144149153 [Haemaphysalis longicornis]